MVRYQKTIILMSLVLLMCSTASYGTTVEEIITDLNNEDLIIRSRALDRIIGLTPGIGFELREEYKDNYKLKLQ